jgi:hypothetical protein
VERCVRIGRVDERAATRPGTSPAEEWESAGMEQEPGRTDSSQSESGAGRPAGEQRRFGGSRLRPRVEFGRRPPQPQPGPGREVVEAEVLPEQEPLAGPPLSPFGPPREFAGGRVRVYGCSPGCLIASLLVSLFLTLVLNAIF